MDDKLKRIISRKPNTPLNRHKKKRSMLPNKLLIIKNPDKIWHQKWQHGDNMLNFPHPWRAVLLGLPNCSKTSTIKNILIRQNPPFERVIIIHCNPKYTKEYDDIDGEMFGEIPPINFWDGQSKTLCILDDIDFKNMKGDQMHRLNRLYGNISTHNNVSVALCAQDTFQVPPIVRRCSNLWILWKMGDLDNVSRVAKKTGLTSNQLHSLFDKHCKLETDSIWIDRTKLSPYPLRSNGFTIIKI